MSESVLTIDDAARLLQITSDTVQTLLESGQMAGRQIEGEWRTTHRAVVYFVDGGVGDSACCPCPPAATGARASGCCSGLPGCC